MSLVSTAFTVSTVDPGATVQWTPALDGSGNVIWSDPSYTSLPLETYIEVMNTTFNTQVDAKLRAGSFPSGYPDAGGTSPTGYMGYNDFEGIGWDDTTGRGWMKCGGHSGSWDNGIYRFEIEKMDWFVELEPTNPASFSTAYKNQTCVGKGTYTIYVDNSCVVTGAYDIIPHAVDARDTRTAKHQWGGILPAQDGSGLYILTYTPQANGGLSGYDFYNFSSQVWTRYNGRSDGPAPPSFGSYTYWRPNGNFLITNSDDGSGGWMYGPPTGTFSAVAVPIFTVSQTACQIGDDIYCFTAQDPTGGTHPDPSAFFIVDMNTMTNSGMLNITGTVPPHATSDEGPGCAYVPELGKILKTRGSGPFELYAVNPSSPYDSALYVPNGVAPVFSSTALIYNKMHYYPNRNILVIPSQDGRTNIRIIKFA